MTHLTPGAKALLDGKEVVEILSQHEQYPAWHWVSNANRHHDEPVFVDRLIPLLSATITEDGKARGEDGRTWEVEYTQYSSRDFEGKKMKWGESNGHVIEPGTPVLGYEKDGRFVIVEVEQKGDAIR